MANIEFKTKPVTEEVALLDPPDAVDLNAELPSNSELNILVRQNEFDQIFGIELREPAASLRGHTLFAHFRPGILANYGEPIHDLELLAIRGESGQWIADKLTQVLQGETITSKSDVELELAEGVARTGQMVRIVNALRYMELLGLATVSWDKVEAVVPSARREQLTLTVGVANTGGFIKAVERDCCEGQSIPDVLKEHMARKLSISLSELEERMRKIDEARARVDFAIMQPDKNTLPDFINEYSKFINFINTEQKSLSSLSNRLIFRHLNNINVDTKIPREDLLKSEFFSYIIPKEKIPFD